MENTDKIIREIQLATVKHYNPENYLCRPFCCYTLWKRYIYPVYGCSYKTYTQYLKVRFPEHTKYADYLLPTPRQYGTDAIRKIRAIYEYKQKHYPKAGRRERTIKSIWSEFIKTHFYIDYSGFLVYSRINPDDIEDAQAGQ